MSVVTRLLGSAAYSTPELFFLMVVSSYFTEISSLVISIPSPGVYPPPPDDQALYSHLEVFPLNTGTTLLFGVPLGTAKPPMPSMA